MIRTLKLMGVAAVAALALSAVGASSALAVPQFTAATYPVSISGSQSTTHVFTASGREVTCASATFTASASAASSTLTVTPTYTTCHVVIFGITKTATVTMNGCTYVFHATEKVAAGEYKSHTDIACPVGNKIEVHVYNTSNANDEGSSTLCTITVPAQTGKTTVKSKNLAGGTVESIAEVTGLTSEVSPEGLTCGSGTSTATYAGNTILEGKDSSNNADAISVSGE